MAKPFAIGSICYKTHGRDAGKKVIVVEAATNGFVFIEGRTTKKTKTNTIHLLPTGKTKELPKNHTNKDIAKLLGEAD